MGFIFDILIWIESTIRILDKIRIEAILEWVKVIKSYIMIYHYVLNTSTAWGLSK